MRLETLNIWGGKIHEPLIQHVKEQSGKMDIFCFQEVFYGDLDRKPIVEGAIMDIFPQLASSLPDHKGYFAPSQNNEEGLAVFVRNNIVVTRADDIFVYRWKNAMTDGDSKNLGRNLQYVQFEKGGKNFTIANFHGLWNGGGKDDSPDRIEQSKKIRMFLEGIKGSIILCGDFNLLPDTLSLSILEDGMRNLVKEYKVTTTRSSHYKKPEKFADYILVSPDVEVIDFRVLQDVVSDHLPLYLEF